MKSSITLSLVPEAKGGPFVFWDGIEDAFQQASLLGFHALEIFPTSFQSVSVGQVLDLCAKYDLKVSAVGTGAGWVLHKWHLSHPSAEIRTQAYQFISEIIGMAASLGAPAIIGSMQGRVENGVSRNQALEWLAKALIKLGAYATEKNQILLYEPLNRYETNLLNRTDEAVRFLECNGIKSVKLLADLFHMNIEESSIPEALEASAQHLGHIHFADSNRHAMGFGHTDASAIAETLRSIGYQGYLSAEILPLPTSRAAAVQATESFQRLSTSL